MSHLLLALLLAAPAAASGPDWMEDEVERLYSPAHEQCLEAASGRTVPMLDCDTQEFALQEARLDGIYRRAVGPLPRAQRNRLRASQKAWVRKRKVFCWNEAIRGDGGTGTMARLIASSCVLANTIRRTIMIERFAAGKASLTDLAMDLPDERALPVVPR